MRVLPIAFVDLSFMCSDAGRRAEYFKLWGAYLKLAAPSSPQQDGFDTLEIGAMFELACQSWMQSLNPSALSNHFQVSDDVDIIGTVIMVCKFLSYASNYSTSAKIASKIAKLIDKWKCASEDNSPLSRFQSEILCGYLDIYWCKSQLVISRAENVQKGHQKDALPILQEAEKKLCTLLHTLSNICAQFDSMLTCVNDIERETNDSAEHREKIGNVKRAAMACQEDAERLLSEVWADKGWLMLQENQQDPVVGLVLLQNSVISAKKFGKDKTTKSANNISRIGRGYVLSL